MANRLVNRLCKIYVPEDPEWFDDINIAYHAFVASLYAILDGAHTVAQVKNFYQMNAEDEAAFDLFIAQVNARPDLVGKMLAGQRFNQVLAYWEMGGVTGYTTPDEIQTALLAI